MKRQQMINRSFSNFWGLIRRRWVGATISLVLVGVISIATLSSGSANAWGPIRSTYTMEHPAHEVRFNSITDNDKWGDERRFVIIKDITSDSNSSPIHGQVNDNNNGDTASSHGYTDVADYTGGTRRYMVAMFVHNNAQANLNLVAKNVRARLYAPTAGGTEARLQGSILADNCGADNAGHKGEKCVVYDETYIRSSNGKSFKLNYVADSARYYNNNKDFKSGGFKLTNNLSTSTGFTTFQLGESTMNGDIAGCLQHSGYVTFVVEAKPNTTPTTKFNLTKEVSVDGKNWHTDLTVKPSDKLYYRIVFHNNGTQDLKNVILRDNGASSAFTDDGVISSNKHLMDYIPGTVKYVSIVDGHQKTINVENASQLAKGANIGTFVGVKDGNPKGTNAVLFYQARINKDAIEQCGVPQAIENEVMAITSEAGSKIAGAKVTTTRDCNSSYNVTKRVDKTSAKPGDTINYSIDVKNTGEKELKNIQIMDKMPKVYAKAKVTFVGIKNEDVSGDLIKDGKLTIKSLPANSVATINIAYTLKSAKDFRCGDYELVNQVTSKVDGGVTESNKKDNKVVTKVHKDCGKTPGSPNTGISIKNATLSLGLFLALATTLVVLVSKKKPGKK